LKVAKREQTIISLLESRGEISVNELSSILDVSVSTFVNSLLLCRQMALSYVLMAVLCL